MQRFMTFFLHYKKVSYFLDIRCPILIALFSKKDEKIRLPALLNYNLTCICVKIQVFNSIHRMGHILVNL